MTISNSPLATCVFSLFAAISVSWISLTTSGHFWPFSYPYSVLLPVCFYYPSKWQCWFNYHHICLSFSFKRNEAIPNFQAHSWAHGSCGSGGKDTQPPPQGVCHSWKTHNTRNLTKVCKCWFLSLREDWRC